MTTGEDHPAHHGVLQSAIDMLVGSTRAVTQMVTQAGSAAGSAGARVVPDPVADQVRQMLHALRSVLEQAPQLTDEFEVLVNELHAKRLSIQALRAELDALDDQLAILERALEPVHSWSKQWSRVQHAILDTIDRDLPADEDH
jgi:hypothetical protein